MINSEVKELIESDWDLGRIRSDIDVGIKTMILSYIPAYISPKDYPSHLLSGVSVVCYEELASRMASAGYPSNAKTLLEITNLRNQSSLYIKLCQFEIANEVDGAGITWRNFNKLMLREYLERSPKRDQIMRKLMANGLFTGLDEMLQNMAGIPKIKLHPCLEDRLNLSICCRSLRAEMAELSEKGEVGRLQGLISRTLELLVKRREMGTLDLDTFLAFDGYTEFGGLEGGEEARDELESFCFQLLESLA